MAAALFVREGLSATVAAETVAALRHEVQHALRVWVPPPDSYRAVNLRLLALHEDTLVALRELARGAGRDDLVQALAGADQLAP